MKPMLCDETEEEIPGASFAALEWRVPSHARADSIDAGAGRGGEAHGRRRGASAGPPRADARRARLHGVSAKFQAFCRFGAKIWLILGPNQPQTRLSAQNLTISTKFSRKNREAKRGQRAFDHTTGQGYVKSQRGHYHDGIFTKRNKFNLLLHETFGGGFSPPAVAKINRLARKAQRSGVDRTAYPPHSRLSFVSHHAERISIASVKGVNRAILDRRAKLASELSRRA